MPPRKSYIGTLIQSGRGIGPMKPQQPPKRREGANSGRVCTLEDESSAFANATSRQNTFPSLDKNHEGIFCVE